MDIKVPEETKTNLEARVNDAQIIENMIKVEDQHGAYIAAKNLLELSAVLDAISEEEKKILVPLKEVEKGVKKLFAPAAKEVSSAIASIKKKILDYRIEGNQRIEDAVKAGVSGALIPVMGNSIDTSIGTVSVRSKNTLEVNSKEEIVKAISKGDLPIDLVEISTKELKRLNKKDKTKYCVNVESETLVIKNKEKAK